MSLYFEIEVPFALKASQSYFEALQKPFSPSKILDWRKYGVKMNEKWIYTDKWLQQLERTAEEETRINDCNDHYLLLKFFLNELFKDFFQKTPKLHATQSRIPARLKSLKWNTLF